MCFWHFLSNILQEHTQPLLTGLSTSFQITNQAAHSVHSWGKEKKNRNCYSEMCFHVDFIHLHEKLKLINYFMTHSKLVTSKYSLYCQKGES